MDGKSDENIYKSRIEKMTGEGINTTSPSSETLMSRPKIQPITITLTPQQIAGVLQQITEYVHSI